MQPLLEVKAMMVYYHSFVDAWKTKTCSIKACDDLKRIAKNPKKKNPKEKFSFFLVCLSPDHDEFHSINTKKKNRKGMKVLTLVDTTTLICSKTSMQRRFSIGQPFLWYDEDYCHPLRKDRPSLVCRNCYHKRQATFP